MPWLIIFDSQAEIKISFALARSTRFLLVIDRKISANSRNGNASVWNHSVFNTIHKISIPCNNLFWSFLHIHFERHSFSSLQYTHCTPSNMLAHIWFVPKICYEVHAAHFALRFLPEIIFKQNVFIGFWKTSNSTYAAAAIKSPTWLPTCRYFPESSCISSRSLSGKRSLQSSKSSVCSINIPTSRVTETSNTISHWQESP